MTSKLYLFLGERDLTLHQIIVYGPQSPHSKQHLDRFSRFRKFHAPVLRRRPCKHTNTDRDRQPWRRNYADRGGVHCTPQVQDLYPPVIPSQSCGLRQNFKQTTLTTRLYKVRTNLYPPPTYENVPTRLRTGHATSVAIGRILCCA